jgi:hypothetical protein
LEQFFHKLHIKANSILFLLIDDTIVRKTGKKIPGCSWYKDHTKNLARVFGHQWVISALFYRDFLLPLRAKLYHPKGARGCGPFHTKITLAKKIIQNLNLPIPCKLYVLVDSWYWTKDLVKLCRRLGYHMISQLKSNSIIWIKGKRIKLNTLSAGSGSNSVGMNQFPYREISISIYGKTRNLRLAKFIGEINGLGKVAIVVVKEKRKKPFYLVSTNLYLSAIDVLKYYARRWKIEQMIKDLKQRLGFGDYQVRSLKAIERHVALVLLSYFVLVLLKIIQWLRNKKQALDLSIRYLAFQLRRHILSESIILTLKAMRIRFKQNILDTYLAQIWV